MSKLILYVRTAVKSSRTRDGLPFTRHESSSVITSYQQAVLIGQRDAGYGNFFVDTGDACPTREDQLLLEPRKRRKRVAPEVLAAQLVD